MKKWKCTVCGYIHEGENPPDECPLCKAPADKFELVDEEKSTKHWKCTVCGYVHNGEEPPEECPICKAGKDKFVEVDVEGELIPDESESGSVPKPGFIGRLLMNLHVHPIAVHFPNGILPVAVIFLALAIFKGMVVLESVAYYNLIAVAISLPVVLFTGYMEWKNRYNKAKTFIFFSKIAASVTIVISLGVLLVWRYVEPTVAAVDSPFRYIYFGVAVVMLCAVGIAGHLGGKLVFGTRDS